MIGELCSSGGGQRIRNSYGNIHGYHANRCHFGSNRAVSLDQYSSNNRRLSDGLPQVISDSNVFYGRHNREAAGQATAGGGGRAGEDLNMNTNLHATQAPPVVQQPHSALSTQQQQQQQLQLQLLQQQQQQQQQSLQHQQQQLQSGDAAEKTAATVADASAAAAAAAAAAVATSNGNISPTLTQHATTVAASNGSARSSGGGTASVAAGSGGTGGTGGTVGSAAPQASGSSSSSSWKSRLRQFSDYFSFSFDKGNKRFGSTRSSPCAGRGNNNATLNGGGGGGAAAATADGGLETGVKSACCTISNSFPSPGGAQLSGGGGAGAGAGGGVGAAAGAAGVAHAHGGVARHRAYSLDVPCSRHHATTRYSSGDSSSRKSSRHDDHNNSSNISNNTNNSNNTLHSSSGIIGELSGIRIRIGSAEDGSTATVRGSIAGAAGEQQGPLLAPSISCELGLGMTSGSSSEAAPKI